MYAYGENLVKLNLAVLTLKNGGTSVTLLIKFGNLKKLQN